MTKCYFCDIGLWGREYKQAEVPGDKLYTLADFAPKNQNIGGKFNKSYLRTPLLKSNVHKVDAPYGLEEPRRKM